jgi:hypothetical protein
MDVLFKLYIPRYSKFHVVGIRKSGNFPFCPKSEHIEFPYCAKSVRMRMTAVLILLASGDFVANLEMNEFEEEMNTDYNKTVTTVSRGTFRLEALSC